MDQHNTYDSDVANIRLSDLPFSSAFSLWGFRAIATGHVNCPAVINGYHRALGQHAEKSYKALKNFVFSLSRSGRRSIKIAMPGCLGVTADELSILGAIHAAQTQQNSLLRSHLSWLLGSTKMTLAYHSTMGFGLSILDAGLCVSKPALNIQSSDNAQHGALYTITNTGENNVRTLH